MTSQLSKNIAVDDEHDVATIYGHKVSGSLLRAMFKPTAPHQWFRVVEENGTLVVHWKTTQEE